MDSYFSGKHPRVDTFDARDVVVLEVGIEVGERSEVAFDTAFLSHRKALDTGSFALDVFRVYSIVADERVGHYYDLTFVGGVSEDFLVACHTGVEDDLADPFAFCAKAPSR